MMSPMMLDNPDSANNKRLVMTMYAVMTFPIVCLISLPLAWYVYGNFSETYGCLLVFVPLVNIGMLLVFLLTNGNGKENG